jgi:DNA processing protein
MSPRTLAWLALNHLPGAGAVTLRRLVSRFGSPETALGASREQLIGVGSLSPAQADELIRVAGDMARIERIAASLQQAGVSLLTDDDDHYPANLRPLRDRPPLLYVCGTLTSRDDVAAAMVGTRTPSHAAVEVTQRMGEALAARGVTVVSGLALGVDAAAHRGALAARTSAAEGLSGVSLAGRTIAVLGSGIDRVTPREHRALAQQVASSGALVSELAPGTRARREALLARNRIQAGLSRAVIVAQCRSRGGSFATAQAALAAGRLVFAVSWPEQEFADGARRLADMGARIVSAAAAVNFAAAAAVSPLSAQAQREIAFDDRA